MPVARVTCPPLWAAALGAAKPSGVSLTTGAIAPASLRYDRLNPVAGAAGPRCLAGDPLLGCVPARLSSVIAMAASDGFHGPRCSLPGLEPVAFEYHSCNWPGGSAGSPQCVRTWGCGSLRPVPLAFSVRARLRCPGPLGACSPVRAPFVFHARCPSPLGACSPVRALCAVCVCCWWLCRGSPPPPFFLPVFLFFAALVLLCVLCCFLMPSRVCLSPFVDFFGSEKIKWKRGHMHTADAAWASGAALQQC